MCVCKGEGGRCAGESVTVRVTGEYTDIEIIPMTAAFNRNVNTHSYDKVPTGKRKY